MQITNIVVSLLVPSLWTLDLHRNTHNLSDSRRPTFNFTTSRYFSHQPLKTNSSLYFGTFSYNSSKRNNVYTSASSLSLSLDCGNNSNCVYTRRATRPGTKSVFVYGVGLKEDLPLPEIRMPHQVFI